MTGKPSRTPIYTRQELVELVGQHDGEHPDHGNECSCHDGLIATLRTQFAPAVLAGNLPPRQPPAAQAAKNHERDTRRPWLTRRAGESQAQYDFRTSHSCYNCGVFIVDMAALNRHEDECSARGRRKAEDG